MPITYTASEWHTASFTYQEYETDAYAIMYMYVHTSHDITTTFVYLRQHDTESSHVVV